MNKQALIKLAQVRLAINYVLRNRLIKKAETVDFNLNSKVPTPQTSLGNTGISQVNVPDTFRHPGGNLGDPYPQSEISNVPYHTSATMYTRFLDSPDLPADIRDRAKKLDLMRWYVSQGGKLPLRLPVPMDSRYNNSSFKHPNLEEERHQLRNGAVFSGAASYLPHMGHEWSHNVDWLNPKSELSRYNRHMPFLTVGTSNPSGTQTEQDYFRGLAESIHQVPYEYEASFVTLPGQMKKMLSDDPNLFRTWNAYSEASLRPALETYLRSGQLGYQGLQGAASLQEFNNTLNKYNAARRQMKDMANSKGIHRYDDWMYSQLLDYAMKHGYDPARGWWNNRGLNFYHGYMPVNMTDFLRDE